MRKLLFFLLIVPNFLFSQGNVTVSGIISDLNSGETLIGASIYSSELKLGVSSNSYGFFSIKLPKGSNSVQAIFMGYQSSSFKINLLNDTVLNFALKPGLILKEVTVKGTQSRNANPYFSTLNMMRLNIAKMSDIPVILGERDLLKAIQYLPGIKGGAENTAGF